MLWIEFATLAVIVTVLAALLIHTGFHIDADQLRLKGLHFGATGSGAGAGYLHLRRI